MVTVFSVKVSDDLKEKLKALMEESGMQGKDFMEEVVKVYELNAAKDIMPSAAGDLAELQAITRRMNDIFVSLIERNSNLMKDRESTLQSEIEKKDRVIISIQGKLDETLEELTQLRTEIESSRNRCQELEGEISQRDTRALEQERNYRKLLESREELITEYKEKNDALNGVIIEYQGYKVENKELATSISELNAETDRLRKQVEERERSEEKLQAEMDAARNQHEFALLRIQIEHEQAILALRERHQSRIEQQSHEHSTKVKDLLDEIENIRVPRNPVGTEQDGNK